MGRLEGGGDVPPPAWNMGSHLKHDFDIVHLHLYNNIIGLM